MTQFFATLSLLFLQPVPIEESPKADEISLSVELRAAMRCAAAFAVIAAYQDMDDPIARDWPEMEPRGREFFVRTSVRLIDETGASLEQIEALFSAEVRRLTKGDELEKVKPACLLMLNTSGL